MFRRSCIYHVSTKGSVKPEIFNVRKSPFGMQGKKLHSHLLSDHALTLKASREEALYKQRTLEERGAYEEAQRLAEETAATEEGKRYREMRWVYIVAGAGYIAGHFVGHQIFAQGEIRLPYDPVNGFLHDLEESKGRIAKSDANIENHVLGIVLASKNNGGKRSALH